MTNVMLFSTLLLGCLICKNKNDLFGVVGEHHQERREKSDLHMGQTVLWLVENHLAMQEAWYLWWHVRQVMVGRRPSGLKIA